MSQCVKAGLIAGAGTTAAGTAAAGTAAALESKYPGEQGHIPPITTDWFLPGRF